MQPSRRTKAETTNTVKDLLRRLSRGGFKSDFARAVILPDWWDDSCTNDASLVPEVEIRVSRFMGIPVEQLRASTSPIGPPALPGAQLRRVANVELDRLHPSIHAGLRIAGAVARCLRISTPPNPPPKDPLEWRASLPAHDLAALVSDLWRRGIPVVPLEFLPSPKYQGISCIVEGRPVIGISLLHDRLARIELLVGHEAGHVARGDCSADAPVVDENQSTPDVSLMEQEAERFSWSLATGGQELPEPPRQLPLRDLAPHAEDVAGELGINPGVVIWSWATRLQDFAGAELAFRALYQTGGFQILRRLFDEHVDVEAASETDRALLRCVFGDPDRSEAAG